tara:strand:+ start:216 stop:488 length:273 start_codon:yes stop_codon:yes gene_type:complete
MTDKNITITVKKKTLDSVYNQVRLCNDMGFPNFQKGEPINDLMREVKRDINKQIRAKKINVWKEFFNFWPMSIVVPLMLLSIIIGPYFTR